MLAQATASKQLKGTNDITIYQDIF